VTADDLRLWQQRCNLRTDALAAQALGIGIATFRRKRTGRAPIGRQTELLARHHEASHGRLSAALLGMAEAIEELARLTAAPVDPEAAHKVVEVITKVIDQSSIRGSIV